MKNSTLYTGLAFAGATPFVACALLPLLGVSAFPPFGDLHALAASYGLAILCFLAGAHWAMYLLRYADIRMNLLLASNVVFLLVWGAYVLATVRWSILVQLFAFVVLLLIDIRLLRIGVITQHYLRVRGIATGLAVVSLAVILFS